VREFANFTGVTIRTLHHYEHLGLLQPGRTNARYRVYARSDLERLEQIIALKFLGLPLQQIRTLLDRDPLVLADALQVQLAILEEKRRLLDRAIAAVGETVKTIQAGNPVEVTDLKRIIGEINMQENTEFMQKYFSKESWAKWKDLKKHSAPAATLRRTRAWIELLCDVEAALGQDYASKKVQGLAARWMELSESVSQGDQGIQAGWQSAWQDRQHWPAQTLEQMASYDMEKISLFIFEALKVSANLTFKKYYSAKAWQKRMELQKRPEEEKKRMSQALTEFYREVAASLAEDPRSEKARRLATRWMELLDIESDGDLGVRTGLMKAIAGRDSWPLWLKRWVASRCQLTVDAYDEVHEFIERALARQRKR
jgi:DNA-binding transcriptional MerR regulator